MSQIIIRDLFKNYRLGELQVPVLRGVSLEIREGEMVALIGASGSGKTTLMNIIGCLDRASSGSYSLNGKDITQCSGDQRAELRNTEFGFVFQNFNLLPRTTALDNVLLPLLYSRRPLPREAQHDRATELLKQVGLEERMHHQPSQLSGGQQQRVAVARALVGRPKIILADEPTGNLDSRTAAEVLELFRRLNKDSGVTVILVTHDADVAAHAARKIRIRDGVITEDLQ